MKRDRYARGWAKLQQVSGNTGGPILAPLDEVAPGFSRYIVEFVFGDIFSRPGLDLKSREIVALAALATRGDTRRQLEVHIGNALKTGSSRQEIVEVFIEVAVFAGLPAAMNALFIARDVFADLDRRASQLTKASPPRRRAR